MSAVVEIEGTRKPIILKKGGRPIPLGRWGEIAGLRGWFWIERVEVKNGGVTLESGKGEKPETRELYPGDRPVELLMGGKITATE